MATQPAQAEMVVEEGVSRFGLHELHVVRAGSPVDRARWMDGKEVEAVYEYEEKEIGMWHLRLWWKESVSSGQLSMASGGGGEGK